jgi:hypothetical protein
VVKKEITRLTGKKKDSDRREGERIQWKAEERE